MRQLLKRDVNDESIAHGYNPKIGIPALVDGALTQNDIMRLQKLKQEIFPDSIHLQRMRLNKSQEPFGSQTISKIAQSQKQML